MTPPFDNHDPDDFEDFLLINNHFNKPNDTSNDDGDNQNSDNNNAGCGTLVLLVMMVLLLSGYLFIV
jgi:hypothetical protein